jgi:hypothetical protein
MKQHVIINMLFHVVAESVQENARNSTVTQFMTSAFQNFPSSLFIMVPFHLMLYNLSVETVIEEYMNQSQSVKVPSF